MTKREKELLNAAYVETHQAADMVSKAWSDGAISPDAAEALRRHLQKASANAQALEWQIKGGQPPKEG